ncbi:MAG: UDP-N-acetylmuramate--L-alanine ligase [Phycisphaerales bacterium]|nr:UDP-N-acetylmuramate--L-alanine ligase [Phycisphaerales bacterium]
MNTVKSPNQSPISKMQARPIELGASRPFMVGIGGCGMSALARLITESGTPIHGCDSTPSPVTNALSDAGIRVGFEESAGVLPADADLVIASAAIKPEHPVLLEATERNIPIMSYPEALGVCMRGRTGVAIAGTHGKSTTTAMLGCALTDAGIDPSVIVGATCNQLANGALGEAGKPVGYRVGPSTIPTGAHAGKPGVLIAEACEFNRSFHNLHPTIASIASIEADHLDIYGSLDAVVEAFTEFARLIPSAEQGGKLIIAHDGAHRREVTAGLDCAVETIGFNPSSDWVIACDPSSGSVTITEPTGESSSWTLAMPGEHNAFNSAMAFALGRSVGADRGKLAASLGAFRGLDRRLQFLGERDFVRVYDDYGHHPTEIDATLRALRQSQDPAKRGGRLVCVFQPHQHSRTRFFLEEFATSFEHADIVIVPHIYFVRDSQAEKHKVSSADLVDRLRQRGVRAMHLYPFEAIIEQLENVCRPGDLLVVMGAGPVWQVGRGFLKLGSNR